MNPTEGNIVNIDAAESLIGAQEAVSLGERDTEEINEMIKTLQGVGVDAPNVRAAIAKLIVLRDEAVAVK